jgi:hypothetical protein
MLDDFHLRLIWNKLKALAVHRVYFKVVILSP